MNLLLTQETIMVPTHSSQISIHKLFEDQVLQTPQAIALIFRETSLTYQELNERANQVAYHLKMLGIDHETFIGIYVERSLEMIIGILGILKAGGVYIPLDPTYPPARLSWMLSDAKIQIVLTQETLLSLLPSAGKLSIICLNTEHSSNIENLPSQTQAEDLAYVMYTSGSTGQPKGVCITHRGVIRLVKNTHYAHFSAHEVFLQLAPISFDASTFEIWGALLNGAKLVIMPPAPPSLEEIGQALRDYHITTLWLTAGLFHKMVEERVEDFKPLRQLLAGGEVLSAYHVKKVLTTLENIKLINGYGPTENTTFTCCYAMTQDDPIGETVPIGYPISNTQVYLLDEQLQVITDNSPGELYVGGDGLARAYLNRPHLTAEKFIVHPHYGRLYKTGDWVRRRPEGMLEFIGRVDDQIKLRGFRIEPGEIEATLQQFPQVSQALVMLREQSPGNNQLVAYVRVTPEALQQNDFNPQLQNFLAERLPPYMLPSAIVRMLVFPLTPNGKIDREALPLPLWGKSSEKQPHTPTEITLHQLFCQVLHLTSLGIDENFFELGGHSLLATQLLSRIRKTLAVELPLASLFEAPTIEQLAKTIDHSQNPSPWLPLQALTHTDECPLSFAQQQLWFEVHLAPEQPVYNEPVTLYLHGNINVSALEQSLNELVRRHAALRANFKALAGQPSQVITSSMTISLPYIDLRNDPDQEAKAVQLATQEAQKPFDLAHEKLFRALFLRLGEQEYRLYLVLHHIIFDGSSLYTFLLQELENLYQAFSIGQASPLSEPVFQYPDFVLWQKNELHAQNLAPHLTYWKQQLSGLSPLHLPTDHPRAQQSSFQGSMHTFAFSQELTTALKILSHQTGVTLYMLFLAAFKILLYRYCGQEDIVVGTVKSNRHRPEFETVCGLFLNTLVLRTNISSHQTFLQFLQQVKKVTLEADAHQALPFESLVSALHPTRQIGVNPLFQVVFTFDPPLAHSTWHLNHFDIHTETAKFDLTLELDERPSGVLGRFEYRTDLFEKATIIRMVGHLTNLLENIVTHPEQRLSDLTFLAPSERHQLLVEWNPPPVPFSRKCVHQLFEEQVEKTPEAMAVMFENQSLSYQELNQRANQLAHHLKTLGVQTETLVGICVERSLEMVIGLLAILKAGGVYVPFDPTYPQERLTLMWEDTQVKLLIAPKKFTKLFPSAHLICLEDKEFLHESQDNLDLETTPEQLAYIMYTSGSTGTPKGTMIPHQGITRLVCAPQDFTIDSSDIFLQLSPLSFDASTLEIWAPLLNGAQLLIMPPQPFSLEELAQTLRHHPITTIWLTASLFHLMVENHLDDLKRVKQVLAGGEVLSVAHVKKFLHVIGSGRLINGYGPTENTTFTCCYPMTTQTHMGQTVPIGRPISQTQVYLLDRDLHPVPIGIPGELYTGGAGLARGYLNRPELTAEKFIPNPFSDDPSARLYKTGDLARYLPDGNIEYLGRIDTQVKLRGFRIELGEIEAILTQHEAIKEAVIIVREDSPGDKRLIGYVILRSGRSETASQLRQFLKDKLPEYMVPSTIVFLEALPLTPNGKVDRRALPPPEYLETKEGFVAPRNDIELQLQHIWEEILQVHPIGVTQNFFEFGGHSLLAIQLISRIRSTLDVELPLRTLFERPTISNLAIPLNTLQRLHFPPIQLIDKTKNIPLSFAQQRLWFLDQLEGPSSTYNLPLALRLHGKLNPEILQKSLIEIIQRHESLRTTFLNQQGTPYQIIHSLTKLWAKQPVLSIIERPKQEAETMIQQEAQTPFNLVKGPLFRATLYPLGAEEYLLLVVMHHIISDGWSVKNFTEELTLLYQALTQNLSPHLPPLPIQYTDFAHWQRQWLTGTVLDTQLKYWKNQLADCPPRLNLPTDYPRPPRQSFHGSIETQQFSSRLLAQLNQFSLQQECTLFMSLVAAFATLLSRYTGTHDLVIGTAIANRTLSETESLIGFFINTLALRVKLEGNPPFHELLKQVKQTTLEAYTHGDLPFEKLLEELNPERDLSHTPIFQVMVVLENMPKSIFQLGDLKMTSFPLESQTTKFDLNFHWSENDEGLLCTLWYNTDLFKTQTIQRFLDHFETLLEDIVTHPHQRLSQLRLLTEAEQHRFAHATHTVRPNLPFLEFPQGEESISARFEQQVQLYPHHLAVKTKRYTWTYQEFNEQVHTLASVLLSRASGEHVALLFDHDAPMLVAILGVLKAGKVYIPLDSNYPQQRLEYLLQDSQATTLLCSQEHSSLAHTLMENVPLSLINLDSLETVPAPVHWPVIIGETRAYILYTSGSTGQPKGVVQNHRNVLHFIRCYTNNLHISAQDRLTLLASYTFDAAVVDLFAALLNGATLYPFNLKEEPQLATFLIQEQISIYHSTPTVYRHLIETLSSREPFPHLRLIVLGGEPVKVQEVEKYRAHFSENCLLINGLGSTESTFHLHHFMSHDTPCSGLFVPVGYPLDDTEVWLLDEQGERTEWYGEIGVRSAHLALGYWRQEELTQKVFLPDPEGGERRIYRTGDLARRLGDGCLELLGRKDFQVKIRGVRIELGEIESTLLGHPAVKEAVVVAREERLGEKELVAYLVVRQAMTFLEMREFLKERLPEFMLPSALVILDRLPLTSTGKVNRLALPQAECFETEASFIAPRNEIELQLQRIWEEILQVRPIGVTQNFFEVGGHSLLAIHLLAEIKKTFEKNLPVLTLFQRPTIEQLANIFSHQNGEDSPSQTLTFIQPQGHRPLLFFVGSTNFARLLSISLGNHQPVYGLNIFGLMGIDGTEVSLEIQNIAKQFIQEIRTVQPHGPYYFCAYCGDARIAFEMAQQLKQLDEKVAFLGFIDVLWQKKKRYAKLRRNLLKFGIFVYFTHIFVRKLKYYVLWLKFKWNTWKMRWYHLRRTSSPLEIQQIDFIRNFFSSLGNYSPQPYSGKVTLFLSAEWYTEELNQASQIFQGGIELHEVPGYHDTLFVSPQVEVLAKQLEECLDKLNMLHNTPPTP